MWEDSVPRESLWLLFERSEQLAAMGVRVPAGVLLHGPRGVGKATLVRALAAELDSELISIGPAEVCGGGPRAPAPLGEDTSTAPAAASCRWSQWISAALSGAARRRWCARARARASARSARRSGRRERWSCWRHAASLTPY